MFTRLINFLKFLIANIVRQSDIGMIEFDNPELIISDFILLAYGDTEGELRQDFIGTSKDQKEFVRILYSNAKKKEQRFSNDMGQPIINIIPCDFDNSGYMGYILTCKTSQNNLFNIIFFKPDEKEIKNLRTLRKKSFAGKVKINIGTSDRLPFLFSHAYQANTILLQTNGQTSIYWYENNAVTTETLTNFPRLARNHSSAYIDVDGDMKPELVLVIEEDGENFIGIYDNIRELNLIQKIKMDGINGPLVFADFNGSGCVDIAFTSLINEESFLNILLNTRSAFEIRDKVGLNNNDHTKNSKMPFNKEIGKDFISLPLKNLKPGMSVVLEATKPLSVPTGIYVYDMNQNSYPDLIISMIDKEGHLHGVLLENCFQKNETFKLAQSQFDYIPGTISISTCDFERKGILNVVVNNMENGEYKIQMMQNKENSSRFRLNCLFCKDKKNYLTHIPGITLKGYIAEEKKTIVGHQISQSSFLHLQRPIIFFGLGGYSHIINHIYLGIPHIEAVLLFKRQVLSNSDLILSLKDKHKIEAKLLIFFGRNAFQFLAFLGSVVSINLIVVILQFLRARKKKQIERKKDEILFNFGAL